MSKGLFQRFDGVYLLDGLRTPMVDYQGAFADANPIDLGIKAARAVLARADVDAARVDSVPTTSASEAMPAPICSPAWRNSSKPVPQMRCVISAGTSTGTPAYRPMWRGT